MRKFSLKVFKMWERTEDGLKPTKDILCPICATVMILRFAELSVAPFIPDAYVSSQKYKCPECSLVLSFDVPITKDYYEKLKKRFGNVYLPEWENEIVKRRLKQFGYW